MMTTYEEDTRREAVPSASSEVRQLDAVIAVRVFHDWPELSPEDRYIALDHEMIPFYSTDRDTAFEMERRIEGAGREAMEMYLRALVDIACNGECINLDDFWDLTRATPEQRARAAIKAFATD